MNALNFRQSSSGRTTAFEAVDLGSNPSWRAVGSTLIEQFRALRDDAAALLDQLEDPSEIREEIRRANDYRERTIRKQDDDLGRY